jgi:hypothetical protein
MSKEELVDILYTHGIAAGLDYNGQQALNAMVAAYNKGIEDAVNEVAWIDADILRERIEQLKIKD